MLRSSGRLIPTLMALALASACATLRGPSERDIRMAEVQYDLGVNDFRNSKYETAVTYFQKAVELDPNMSDAHNALGLVWWKKDRLDDALACFERAVQLRPDFADAWNNLGALSMQRKDYARAKMAFEKVLADPVYSTPYVTRANLGWLYHLQGDDRQALAQLKEALALDEAYCAGHKFLADFYEETGKPAEAAEALESFVRFCPEEPEALYRAGQIHLAQGDTLTAARSFALCGAHARKISRDHVFIKPCMAAARELPPLPPEEQLKISRILETNPSAQLPGTKDIENPNRR